MDRDLVLSTLRKTFAGRVDVVAAYVFGSVGRSEQRAGSDVDVGVILAAGPPKDMNAIAAVGRLHGDLETALRRNVDLVVMNGASPDLLHRILRDGEVVHESDHRRRLLFEVQARNEYFDLLPVLQLYRRTVLGGI